MGRLRRLGAVEASIVNRSENLPAKRLYESLGFQAIGQIGVEKIEPMSHMERPPLEAEPRERRLKRTAASLVMPPWDIPGA